MRHRLFVFTVCIICVSTDSARAETDRELVAKIDTAIARAVKFLASKQSPDGAWRSGVYAPFKAGDALTPLVMTALLPLPVDDATSEPCARGMQYLSELSRRTFENPAGLKSIAYPAYTAAYTTIALHQNRRAEDGAIRSKWLQALRDLQLTEASGWKPDDVEYGGWTYGHAAARRPADGQVLGPLDQPNMSATALALVALQLGGVSGEDATLDKALRFVERLRNEDGGFFFISADGVRNKAGVDPNDASRFLSYGSATADALRSLLACGVPHGEMANGARDWLATRFSASAHPGTYAADRKAAQNALYFYWAAAFAQAFGQLEAVTVAPRILPDESAGDTWSQALAKSLLDRQQQDGNWQNPLVDQREDDPIIATSFAIQSLSSCRAMLASESRPDVAGVDETFTCHARDAVCHGEKLQFEPQPQKNTLGCWVNEKDWASWQIAVEKPGEYEVIVWQGCGAGEGGSAVAVQVGDEKVSFKVEATGHFQHFQPRLAGTLKINSAGRQELVLKCLHKAKVAVADVRQIRLVPVAVQ